LKRAPLGLVPALVLASTPRPYIWGCASWTKNRICADEYGDNRFYAFLALVPTAVEKPETRGPQMTGKEVHLHLHPGVTYDEVMDLIERGIERGRIHVAGAYITLLAFRALESNRIALK
jgi:hypothetical protein